MRLTIACAEYDRTRPIIDGRVQIDGCDASVSSLDFEDMFVRALGSAEFDATELSFIQHRETTDGAGEIGPGWEYYLDNLLASRTGSPLPDFADYYPSMQAYYQDQAAAVSTPDRA